LAIAQVKIHLYSAAEADPTGRARIVHPGDWPVRGSQPSLTALLDDGHREGSHPTGETAAGGEYVGMRHQPSADEHAHDGVTDPAASGTAVIRNPRLAKLAYLAHNVGMNTDLTELSVSQARDHFSDAVNRAAFGGEITYVTRGRNQQRAAAIVPAELVEQYEAMIDLEDDRIAHERLADLDAGRTTAVPADEAARALGL